MSAETEKDLEVKQESMYHIDKFFISLLTYICTDSDGPGKRGHRTDKVQWTEFDTLNKDTLIEAIKMMPKGTTKGTSRFFNTCMIMTNVTKALCVLAAYRENINKPFDLDKILGIDIIITELVPDGTIYFLADKRVLMDECVDSDYSAGVAMAKFKL